MHSSPTLRIGLIADVQYADVEDVENFMKTATRRYRRSLLALRNGVDSWVSNSVDLVVDLGDAIDGYRNPDRESGMRAISTVMTEWDRLGSNKPSTPALHLIGNHELYKFTRVELMNGVETTGFHCVAPGNLTSVDNPGSIHYSFTLPEHPSWRVAVLDPYDQSVMREGGGRVGHELTIANGRLNAEFTRLCQSNNPNDIIDGGNYFAGIEGIQCRWAPFNGGIGEEQMQWLERTLENAKLNHEKIIIFSHVIIHPRATPGENCHTLIWNYDAVLSLFHKFSPVVKLVIAGHAHHDGYFLCPETSIHHICIPSPLETPDNLVERTFATLEVHDEYAQIVGEGYVPSRRLDFR
jgi:manganese-dependent ADP-ribose/CDP-alcohol diphosphatase